MIKLNSLKLPRLNQDLLIVLLLVVLSIPTFWNLFRPGYFKMHDDLQAVRIYEMSKCLKDGQIPCRWVPDMGYRFGYPQYNYYGPLPYYIMSLINLFGVGLFDSVKIGFIIPLLLGNIFMYFFAKKLFGVPGALVSTLLYAYSPFRSSDIYSRGAMGETWAFIFFPLILLMVMKVVEKPTWKRTGLLAVSLSCLFVTHNISTLIFSPAVAVWALILLVARYRSNIKLMWPPIKSLFLGLLLSVSLSAFFLLPVLFEKGIAHTESMIGGYFDYRAHFVTIHQLFFTSFWGYGSSEIGPTDDLSFFFSPVMLLMIIAAAVLVIRKIWKRQLGLFEVATVFFLIAGLLATFMTHEKSSFVWSLIPPFVYLQFPWRFLVTAHFFFAITAGYVFLNAKDMNVWWSVLVIFILTFLLSVSFFRTDTWYYITESEKFSGYLWDRQMTISIFDYLPIYAPTPPNHPAPVLPVSSSRYSSIENFKKGTDWIDFTYSATDSSVVSLNILEFPSWKITDNGQPLTHQVDKDGVIFISLEKGTHHIVAKLVNSPVRWIGDILTLIALPLTVFSIFYKKDHVQKS